MYKARNGSREISVTALFCTLNEADNLPYVLPKIPLWVDEVIIVDGHSTDHTVEVATRLWPGARILYQPSKGKGDAIRYGMQMATGDITIILDADCSTNPEEMHSFIDPLLDGYDFVKGSRFLPGGGTADMPLYRRLGDHALTALVNLLFDARYTDLTYGYKAFWTKAVRNLTLQADGFEIEVELDIRALQAGLKFGAVPSFEYPRKHGSGKLSTIRDGFRFLGTIARVLLQR